MAHCPLWLGRVVLVLCMEVKKASESVSCPGSETRENVGYITLPDHKVLGLLGPQSSLFCTDHICRELGKTPEKGLVYPNSMH